MSTDATKEKWASVNLNDWRFPPLKYITPVPDYEAKYNTLLDRFFDHLVKYDNLIDKLIDTND